MKIAAILTTLVIAAASSTAIAQPPVHPDHRDNYGDRDYRYHDPMWVRVSPSLPGHREIQHVFVRRQLGAAQAVRVTAEQGAVFVRQVRVRFRNGQLQTANYNQVLPAGQSLYLDLPGINRNIEKVVVVTRPRYSAAHNGRFAIYAAKRGQQYGYWRDRDRRPQVYRY